MTLIINLAGGPGSGKSTTTAGLFHYMKLRDVRCELVTEYAKDKTYESAWQPLANQWLITGKQDQRLRRLQDQVDIIVTDSPLPTGLLYAKDPFDQPWFDDAVWRLFDSYRNFTVMLNRVKKFQTYGRTQSEDEARQLDKTLRTLLDGRIDLEVDGDEAAPEYIFRALVDRGLIAPV